MLRQQTQQYLWFRLLSPLYDFKMHSGKDAIMRNITETFIITLHDLQIDSGNDPRRYHRASVRLS